MADLLFDGEVALASGWMAVIFECTGSGKMKSLSITATMIMLFLFPAAIHFLSSSHSPSIGGGSNHMDYKWHMAHTVKVSKSSVQCTKRDKTLIEKERYVVNG